MKSTPSCSAFHDPLQRLDHVKHQNWTAIFLDFLIVVLGVYIGVNVTNWNDARKTHARAQSYAERLRDDLHVEYEYALSRRDYFTDAREAGMTAFAGLTGGRRQRTPFLRPRHRWA